MKDNQVNSNNEENSSITGDNFTGTVNFNSKILGNNLADTSNLVVK
ncbi:MAG: hypothetical protein RCG15_01360 [Candidatus Rickettsia vulgarisii]